MSKQEPATIVILNGAPRSGKSSIVRVIQETFDGVWINLGVDVSRQMTPARYQPGIGLRPGGERPDLEPSIEAMYAALYESAAVHSRLGLNVVMDLGHHDPALLSQCARRLAGLPAIIVGVRCPIETILERRNAEPEGYAKATPEDPLPLPVVRWEEAVHVPGIYDLEVDTSISTPVECAEQIGRFLSQGIPTPTALQKLSVTGEAC